MGLPIKRGGGLSGGGGGGGGLAATDVKTGAYSAALNDLVLVDHTGGGFPVTLPDSAPINSTLGVLCVGHDSANRDEVTIDPGTDGISGNHDAKIYLTDDSIILQSDGAGVWRTIDDTLIAHRARMVLTVLQGIVTSTFTKLLIDTIEHDNAALMDTGNSWAMIRRAGSYNVNCGVATAAIPAECASLVQIYLQAARHAQEAYAVLNNAGGPYMSVQRDMPIASGQLIENFYWHSAGFTVNTTFTSTFHQPYITIEENR